MAGRQVGKRVFDFAAIASRLPPSARGELASLRSAYQTVQSKYVLVAFKKKEKEKEMLRRRRRKRGRRRRREKAEAATTAELTRVLGKNKARGKVERERERERERARGKKKKIQNLHHMAGSMIRRKTKKERTKAF